jgi:hypothetical protein
MSFRLKAKKKVINSEDLLAGRSLFASTSKLLKKGLKLKFRDDGKKFREANEDDFHKYMVAEQWQLNPIMFVYFQFLNPAIAFLAFFGGFHVPFIDIMIVFTVSILL